MAKSIFQCVYVSTSQDNLPESELDQILSSSQRNNATMGVTGMLLYGGGNFWQVLEGEEKSVQKIFSRIQQDPRHYDVQIVLHREIAERGFGAWSMGFARRDCADPLLDRLRMEEVVGATAEGLVRRLATLFTEQNY